MVQVKSRKQNLATYVKLIMTASSFPVCRLNVIFVKCYFLNANSVVG